MTSTAGLALAALTLVSGCQPAPDPAPAAVAASAVAASAAQPGDATLTAEIQARLALDAQVQALHISVEASQGHVRLRGVAPDTTLRARIGTLARGVGGVVEVVNEVSVQARAP